MYIYYIYLCEMCDSKLNNSSICIPKINNNIIYISYNFIKFRIIGFTSFTVIADLPPRQIMGINQILRQFIL